MQPFFSGNPFFITPTSSGDGSIAIGQTVGGSTAFNVLFIDDANNLAESPDFIYDEDDGIFTVGFDGDSYLRLAPNAFEYDIGDWQFANNGSQIRIIDGAFGIEAIANTSFVYTDTNGNRGIFADFNSQQSGVGDIDGRGSGTNTLWNDFSQSMISTASAAFIMQDFATRQYFNLQPNGGNPTINIGAITGGNFTDILIADLSELITVTANAGFQVFNPGGDIFLNIAPLSGSIREGDLNGIGAGNLRGIDFDAGVNYEQTDNWQVVDSGGNIFMNVTGIAGGYGDPLSAFTGNYTLWDAGGEQIKFNWTTVLFPLLAQASTSMLTIDSAGTVGAAPLPASIVDNGRVTAATTTQTLFTYPVTTAGVYRLGAWANISAISTESLEIALSWKDENGVTQGHVMYPTGSGGATFAGVAFFPMQTIDISSSAGAGHHISITATVGGTPGTGIIYDAGASIEFLNY